MKNPRGAALHLLELAAVEFQMGAEILGDLGGEFLPEFLLFGGIGRVAALFRQLHVDFHYGDQLRSPGHSIQ